MTRTVGLVLASIFGSLCLAGPAAAAPLTFAYEGYVDSLGGAMTEFFPDVVAQTYFSGTFTLPLDDTTGVVGYDLLFGGYEATGVGGRQDFTGTSDPVLLATSFQKMIDPGPVPVNVQWIKLVLDAGWQTGHLEFLAEGQRDFYKNAFWEGTITDVHPVPEPTSLLLIGIGIGGLAVYRWTQRGPSTITQ